MAGSWAVRRRLCLGLLAFCLFQALLLVFPPGASGFIPQVEVLDWEYSPSDITIYVGQSVEWVSNASPGSDHTVTGAGFDLYVPSTCRKPVCSMGHTFNAPGEYWYSCGFHPKHRSGVVRVVEPNYPSGSSSGAGGAPPPPPGGGSDSAYSGPPPQAPQAAYASGTAPLPSAPNQTGPAIPSAGPGSTSLENQAESGAAGPTAAGPGDPAATAGLPPGSPPATGTGTGDDGIPTIILSAPRSSGGTDKESLDFPSLSELPGGVSPAALGVLAGALLLTGALYGRMLKKRILAATATLAPPMAVPGMGVLPASALEEKDNGPGNSPGDTDHKDEQTPADSAPGADVDPAASTDDPGGTKKALIRREGEIWAIQWGERTIRLNHSKGLEDLSKLLLHPGTEFHVLELAVDGSAPDGSGPQAAAEGLHTAGDDAGAVLDPQAKQSYRQRLRDLEEELAEAESFNDPERTERARAEMDFIARELATAVGLGGKDRMAVSNLERARVLVTKRIRRSIDKIAAEDPVLGRHLHDSVKTGTYCVYRHNPSLSMKWES